MRESESERGIVLYQKIRYNSPAVLEIFNIKNSSNLIGRTFLTTFWVSMCHDSPPLPFCTEIIPRKLSGNLTNQTFKPDLGFSGDKSMNRISRYIKKTSFLGPADVTAPVYFSAFLFFS